MTLGVRKGMVEVHRFAFWFEPLQGVNMCDMNELKNVNLVVKFPGLIIEDTILW